MSMRDFILATSILQPKAQKSWASLDYTSVQDTNTSVI